MQTVVVKSETSGVSYIFDVTFKETHNFQSTLTQNPVQEGAAINDHVYQQPPTFTWDVGVSDCRGIIRNGTFQRSADAFKVLQDFWAKADTLTISTEFNTYHNMLVKSVNVVRDKNSMNAMRATVIFQQIVVTTAVSISISQKTTAFPQTTGQTNGGTKTVTKSTTYKTLQIPNAAFIGATASYNGASSSLYDYFNAHSSSLPKWSSDSDKWNITPIINASITNSTKFTINNNSMTYDQLLKTYGVS